VTCGGSGHSDAQSTAAIFLSTGKLGPVFAASPARGSKALETHAMRPFKRGSATAKAEWDSGRPMWLDDGSEAARPTQAGTLQDLPGAAARQGSFGLA
jgi:hypothetical protein